MKNHNQLGKSFNHLQLYKCNVLCRLIDNCFREACLQTTNLRKEENHLQTEMSTKIHLWKTEQPIQIQMFSQGETQFDVY